ncbi:hypothetical protein EDC65_2408 [Stella humosa]|uniref:Uncharacterized protein n=1 Tax=Stella humosa TaxID=94 RepID=A0A3N1LIA0_9PROT|nr:hypothetical protein [Stella humosa]ROP90558.1 hypothetical protein EDC65_2408 [Stella humosa]BBK29547.1 hypothetical protein STHU_01810 [Stella humosa]
MILGRILGWLLVAAAIVVLGRDLMDFWYRGAWNFIAAGDLWTQLHQESLLMLQPTAQRPILPFYPEAWTAAVAPALRQPAAALLGAVGLLLVLLFRRRRPRRGAFR